MNTFTQIIGKCWIYTEQIDKLVIGSSIVIRNSTVDIFNGFMRLTVSQWGKVSPHPDGIASTPPEVKTIKLDKNLSKVEYELVDES